MAKMKKFKYRDTTSKARARAVAFINGRGTNAAYTSGAQDAQSFKDAHGYNVSQHRGMVDAWNNNSRVKTYTRSARGRMSTNGRTAGGSTWTFTQKDSDGNTVRQSGRSKIATRRQRFYDVRVGLGLAGG